MESNDILLSINFIVSACLVLYSDPTEDNMYEVITKDSRWI